MGQRVTIIEKGKYKNVDGYDWSRIMLSDGTQGYIVARYLEEISDSGSTSSGTDIVKVVCSVGLNVRKSPSTSSGILEWLPKGEYLTRVEQNVSNAQGYTWDKVITESGNTGYVARGDDDENYIEPVKGTGSTPINGTGFKTSGSKLKCEPDVDVKDILNKASGAEIKNSSGKKVTSGNLGTGYTVKYNGTTYTVIKLGDVNGDGKVTAGDYVNVKNYIMDKGSLNSTAKQGADVNSDGKVSAGDYVQVKNHIMGKNKIEI